MSCRARAASRVSTEVTHPTHIPEYLCNCLWRLRRVSLKGKPCLSTCCKIAENGCSTVHTHDFQD